MATVPMRESADAIDVPNSQSLPLSAASPAHFVRALREAAAAPNVDTGPLRDTVLAYTRGGRAAGLPPERVIIGLKAAADNAGMRTAYWGADTTLVEAAVRWCIQEYYRAD